MQTPGRPASPTIHRRTRPEGQEVAKKMRGTNDWFRHDGRNIEEQTLPPSRLTMPIANEIAAKNKKDSEKWYGHDMTPTPMEPRQPQPIQSPKVKANDPAAKENYKKVAGTEEPWYKFEENHEYHTPRVQNRLTGSGSVENKNRNKGNPTSWYHHDHDAGDEIEPSPQHTPRRAGPPVEKKAADEWYNYEAQEESQTPPEVARFHNPDAQGYLQRGRQGSASDWYGHDTSPVKLSQQSPRVTSADGKECASKGMSESGNWFSHDENKDYHEPTRSPRLPTEAAKEMYQRAQGSMNSVLNHDSRNGSAGDTRGKKVNGELAQEVAKRNVQGIMMKYLNDDENREYSSPRPGQRVKNEAEGNYTKNLGNMNDCLSGYPDSPTKKGNRRVKPEAADNAQRNKGTLDLLMNNYGDLPEDRTPRGRRVKPEAAQYAERNKGTLGMMGDFDNLTVHG